MGGNKIERSKIRINEKRQVGCREKGAKRRQKRTIVPALLLLVCFSSVLAEYKASGRENTMVHTILCVCACVCGTVGRAARGVEVQCCALFITCQTDTNPVQQLPGDQWAHCPRK